MADGSAHVGSDNEGGTDSLTLLDLACDHRWVAWQTEVRKGRKATKVPYMPGTTRMAEADDPMTWGTRAEALARAASLPKPMGAGGIGFELGDLGDGMAIGGIDLDTCRSEDGSLESWATQIIALFATYAEVSPSGTGIKLFFSFDAGALPALLREIAPAKGGKVWKRGGGDHPPSIEIYLTHRYFAVTDQILPGAPARLRHVPIELIRQVLTEIGPAFSESSGSKNTEQQEARARSGGKDQSRSAAAFRIAGEMRRAGAPYDAFVQRVRADPQTAGWCQEKGEANGQRELKRAWDRAGQAPPSDLELTEDGVARHFATKYAADFRYCHDTRRWFRWVDTHWQENRDALAFSLARDLVRSLNRLSDFRTKAVTGRTAFVAGVERFAQSDRTFAVTAETWDTHSWLLGTPGGTVDLRKGTLLASRQSDYITKITAVAPAPPGRQCDLWLRFLDEATGKDDDLIRFLQLWCGYCLTGITQEHALLFIHGHGKNGKSVFLNTITGILGDHARTAAMDTFTASKNERHSTELAMLRGARLVTASETEEGRAWAEARIKQLTGGDLITARFMHRDNFTYRPSFKLMIVGNHRPALRNVDDAARRRFNIVPFTRTPSKPDPKLEEKLKEEWPAILRWMIDGCLEWQQQGLRRPQVVTQATEEYFEQQDVFRTWADEECVRDAILRERPGILLANFNNWAARNGLEEQTRNQFRAWAERQPGLSYKRVNGADYVRGIGIKPPKDRRRRDAESDPDEAEGADGGGR